MPEPARFSDLDIHAALQRALATRGYDTATPVQAAVLDPAVAGRDLLVSSQTGSGKTIAFGAALAGTLLQPAVEGATAIVRQAGAPRALIVVPTRELVAQVREELGWLMASTSLRLASFTGGTAVGGDLRALHRGVDVAIGTPGRLVDLMRREKLALGQVEVVVLDEADEMLDLGFREDLETLLGAAPVARRTLLLSATLPSEIRALARRFQRDALAIDPRKGGADAAGGRAAPGAHDDITYVAHLIAGGDRLAAVVNLLRASADARAIVFCTTRDAVGSLHRELVARGFAATAISGERAQAERDRALDQVRQGEAQILVATNVAARGLHLPDVDLIIHADLPLNAESLTHRSGRTGRAGRKGTAVVIASLAERRKAERLLAAAQVRVPWTAPPSGKQIAAAARARLMESLLAEAADGEVNAGAGVDEGDDLLAPFAGKISSDDLARRLLARELQHLPVGETLAPVILPSADSDRRFGAAGSQPLARRRDPGEMARQGVMFRVNLGAQDQADPRWLLPLICRRGGVTRREVGAIRVGPSETLFEIAGDAAADFALSASQSDPRAPQVRMEPVDAAAVSLPPRAPVESAPRRSFPAPPRAPLARHEGTRAKTFGAARRPASGAAAPGDNRLAVAPPLENGVSSNGHTPDRASHRQPEIHASAPDVDPFDAGAASAATPAPPAPSSRAHTARPHAAKPFAGKPYGAKGDRPKPFAGKAYGKPYEAKGDGTKPFAGKPFAGKPFAGKSYEAKGDGTKPFAGKPYPAKPFAGKPYPAKPYAAKAHTGKPAYGKPAHAKSHTGKPHTGKAPSQRKG